MRLENVKRRIVGAQTADREQRLTGGETSSFPQADRAAGRKLRMDNHPTTRIVPRT
jgi:hypothetical protein